MMAMAQVSQAGPWPWPWRYGLVMVVLGVSVMLRPVAGFPESGLAYMGFVPAVVLGFGLCRAPFGWLVVVCGALAGYDTLVPPLGHFRYGHAPFMGLGVFLVSAWLIERVVAGFRQATRYLRGTLRSLSLSEQRYHGILEDQTDFISRLRTDGTVLYVNRAYCRFFGIAHDDIVGQKWHPVALPEDVPMVNEQLATLSKDRPVSTIENRVLTPIGVRWGQFANRGIFDEHGHLIEIQSVGRDITDRKMLEVRLAESMAEVTSLYDGAPCGYCSLDKEGRFVYINATALSWMGVQREDVIGKLSPLDFTTPQGQALFRQSFPKLQALGAVCDLEFDLMSRDGSQRRISINATAVLDENGQFAMSRAVMFDITEITRVRNQLKALTLSQQAMLGETSAALKMSEARLRGIFDSVTDAILTTDEKQVIVMANPAAARMFGYSSQDIMGSSLERFLPERHHAQHRRDVEAFGRQELQARHMGRGADVVGVRSDGGEFPVEATISQVRVGQQQLYTVILRDITERRLAEAALRESEGRLRRLLMLMPEAVLVNSGNRISFVNHAAQSLLGMDEAGLLGRSVAALMVPEVVDEMQSRLTALRQGKAVPPMVESRFVRADGAIRTVESTLAVIDPQGEASVMMVLRDVTELRQTKAALAQSHKDLQRLLAAQARIQETERKRIAREIHDDLQQVLAAIKFDLAATTQKLTKDAPDVAPMLAAISDLAAAAMVSTRRIVNDLRPQILDDLGLLPALESLADQFNQRLGVVCTCQAALNETEADLVSPDIATCLFRVAQEALNNVAKHANATEVSIELSTADGALMMRITDNGQGFASTDKAQRRAFGVMGMRERVRALGGELQIKSDHGAGVTVQVTIPLSTFADSR